MNGYKINEKDIERVMDWLRATRPKEADRGHATQLLMGMNELAKDLVNQDLDFAELLEKAMPGETDIDSSVAWSETTHSTDNSPQSVDTEDCQES